ncbi:MAG: DUF5995 family protein [Pseudobdellovibrionaceae bacterium]
MKKWFSIIIVFVQMQAVAGPKIQKDASYFTNLEEDLAWFQSEERQIPIEDIRGFFLRIYHSVTMEMPNMFKEKQFENPEWVRKLMLKYVSLYRNALECSLSKSCEVSPSWQVAFKENERNKKAPAIQLLLSISAHVNRDLPIALAEIGTDFKDVSLHKDFQRIALIFQRRMPELIGLLQDYQHCSPNNYEQNLINRIIQWAMSRTREQSWSYGAQLADVQTDQEEQVILKQIETHTNQENLSIKLLAPVPEVLMCL